MSVANVTVDFQAVNVLEGVPVAVGMILQNANELQFYYGPDRDLATLNVHYTITLDPDNGYDGFSFTPLEALIDLFDAGVDNIVYVRRRTPATSSMDSTRAGSRALIAAEFDRVWLHAGEMQLFTDRALLFPYGEPGQALPAAAARANKRLAFDSDGNLFLDGTVIDDLNTVAENIQTLLDLFEDATGGPATAVGVTPFTGVVATDVQAALEEIYAEKAALVHTHGDLYYTETEIDTLLTGVAIDYMDAIDNATPLADTTTAGLIRQATAAEIMALATGNFAITPAQLLSAAAFVTLTNAATIPLDMDTFINGKVTITGNREFGVPSNVRVGRSGVIKVTASGGTRSIDKAATNMISVNIVWPISIPSGQTLRLTYFEDESNNVWINSATLNAA